MPSQKASTLHCYELGLVDVSVSRLPAPRRNLTTLVGLATKFVSQFVNLYAYSIDTVGILQLYQSNPPVERDGGIASGPSPHVTLMSSLSSSSIVDPASNTSHST